MQIVIEIAIYALQIISFGIIARALSSWIPNAPKYTLVQLLFRLTDPFIKPVQKILPSTGMMDFSPLVSIIIIQVIRGILAGLL